VVEIVLIPSPVSGEGARRADEGKNLNHPVSCAATPPLEGNFKISSIKRGGTLKRNTS